MSTPKRPYRRLAQLKTDGPAHTRIMDVTLPSAVAEQIAALAAKLRVTKTDLVVALLNEGLEIAARRIGDQ